MDRRTLARLLLRSTLALGAIGALGAAAGCTRWTVVAQANPSPMNVATKFVIEAPHWESTTVGGKSEAEYFAGKDEKQRQSYTTDQAEAGGLFVASLQRRADGLQYAAPGDPQAFVVRPIVDSWEPGFYAAVVRSDARMNMRVQILDPRGQVVDEIATWSVASSTMLTPSSGQRMRKCGEDLGSVTGRYLRSRTGG
jgi:hypothetical protein